MMTVEEAIATYYEEIVKIWEAVGEKVPVTADEYRAHLALLRQNHRIRAATERCALMLRDHPDSRYTALFERGVITEVEAAWKILEEAT